MVTESVTIRLPGGFETRPLAVLVQVASQFESQIHLECGSKKVNAKSIMGMMTLGLDAGEEVRISAEGKDEEEALAAIRKYVTQGQ